MASRRTIRQRRGEAGTGEQREARARELRGGFGSGRGQLAHGGMQGGGAEQHVVDAPAGVEDAAGGVPAVEQFPAVGAVGEQHHDGAAEQQHERGLAPVAAGGDTGDDGEHEDVHRGVGDGGDPAEQRERVVVGIGSDQVDPQQRGERERDDQPIDQPAALAPLAAFADQREHADDKEGVEREVEGVGDGRERHGAAEEAFVVVGEHVAGDEQALTDGEQVERRPPTPAAVAGAPARAEDQRDDAGAADQREHEPALHPAGAGEVRETVAGGEQGGEREVQPPGEVRRGALGALVRGAPDRRADGAGCRGGAGHGVRLVRGRSRGSCARDGLRCWAGGRAAGRARRERGGCRSAWRGSSRPARLHGCGSGDPRVRVGLQTVSSARGRIGADGGKLKACNPAGSNVQSG
jgi:hypothetical protein